MFKAALTLAFKERPTVFTAAKPLLETGNREVLTVLREIALGAD